TPRAPGPRRPLDDARRRARGAYRAPGAGDPLAGVRGAGPREPLGRRDRASPAVVPRPPARLPPAPRAVHDDVGRDPAAGRRARVADEPGVHRRLAHRRLSLAPSRAEPPPGNRSASSPPHGTDATP